MDKLIYKKNGILLSQLEIKTTPKGNVFQGVKRSSIGFKKFGEAYFSFVEYNSIKAWKKHTEMTLNLIVPIGKIGFVIYCEKKDTPPEDRFYQVSLSAQNYCRLTVKPGLWVGFKGLGEGTNMLLNVADLEHDPTEAMAITIDEISYDWSAL